MTRSQDRYDAFAKAVDVPMLVVTLLWLPVLIVPLVVPLHGSMAETFATIDYVVWALFALEYVIKFSLAPRRGYFVRTHLLDLLIVAVPFFRPLRMGRLVRLLRLARVAVVMGEALRRGKSIFTHNGFHFVVLAAATLVFAVRGPRHFRRAHRQRNQHPRLWTRTVVGHRDGDHRWIRRPLSNHAIRPGCGGPLDACRDRADRDSDRHRRELLRAGEDECNRRTA